MPSTSTSKSSLSSNSKAYSGKIVLSSLGPIIQ
jgi:hypothetical protein